MCHHPQARTPTGSYIQAPGFNPGIRIRHSTHTPPPRPAFRGATYLASVWMLNPVGVLYVGGMVRISQGYTLGLNVEPRWGSHSRTPTGSYIQAPGFNPGIYIISTKPHAPQRGATLWTFDVKLRMPVIVPPGYRQPSRSLNRGSKK